MFSLAFILTIESKAGHTSAYSALLHIYTNRHSRIDIHGEDSPAIVAGVETAAVRVTPPPSPEQKRAAKKTTNNNNKGKGCGQFGQFDVPQQ